MAISQTSFTLAGVGSSLELSISGGAEETSEVFTLEVARGMAVLAVTVTDGGPSGVMRGPVGVDVRVYNPDGKVVSEGALRGLAGQITLVENNPAVGKWRIEVSHRKEASAEICATAVFPKWWSRLRNLGAWFRCKTCKVILKALVIFAVVHLAPFAGSALGGAALIQHLSQIAPHLLSALQALLPPTPLEGLLTIVTDYCDNPIERLLARVCHYLRFCT